MQSIERKYKKRITCNTVVAGMAILSIIVFLWFPTVDLWIAKWLYIPSNTKPSMAYRWVYLIVPLLTAATLTLLVFDICCMLVAKRYLWLPINSAIFFMLCWLVGPGLLVNTVLKDHVGRPRPVQLEQFRGHERYVPPFQRSSACYKNCAFVSGHASVGFVFCALSFVFTRYRRTWLLGSVFVGCVIGYVRMVQGGHFLSDVLFSFFVTYAAVVGVQSIMVRWGWSVAYRPGANKIRFSNA